MPNCGITGQIPEWVSSQKDLFYLDFKGNDLDGRFPNWLAELLLFLDLSRNNFSGELPENIGNAKRIKSLCLGGNGFSGNLPCNLTKMVNLAYLDIHENNISGKLHDTLPQIPTLEVLILRNNSLEGYIPINISSLSSLRILDLSHNNLTGSIPREIANLSRMIKTPNISRSFPSSHSIWATAFLQESEDLILNWKKSFRGLGYLKLDIYSLLDLSDNRISDEIPPSLGNLKALKLLNISHNMISGHIPMSFGDLENIESLDLSHNEISGSIPQSLVKLNQLTVLDVSNNRLTGKIPVGPQMDTMVDFENNTGLCGMQIKVTCPEDIRPLKGRGDEEEKQSWFLWEGTWVGFPFGFVTSILIMGYFLKFLQLFKS
ncbi:hypothetical protein L1987_82025 [Smallanthus sonchifolius]|uniref:Uncharacterized protein n=2 Tax=Smallanthus sonchifolius TaxID=185202 RepID=A0ACB8YTP1_9ASTR|nr:hypothetical protein L1987_81997 [Smallanthus sonchifolius]KAI3688314.1 hypothetical protein L1987_82025 [Smallanthus sonchifolius]